MSKDQNVIAFAPRRRGPDPARLREFAATARKLRDERDTTGELVQRLLRETPQEEWGRLAEVEELRNSGTIEVLGREASSRMERDPESAVALTELATTLASRLEEANYPRVVVAQVRAQAWKERAQALCYVSRYDEAMRALDRADHELTPFGTLTHDVAIVQFQRAIVLQHLRRFDEAHELLRECSAVFDGHGDVTQYSKCVLAEGNLLVRRGDYRKARAVLLPLVESTNPQYVGIALSTLGWCAMELGDPQQALAHFRRAMVQYRSLGWDLEVVRLEYGIGAAMLRTAELEEALKTLQSARTKFLDRKLVEEGGLCGLQMIEAWLLRGEADFAQRLASTLVREFSAANLNRRAVAALAYLNETIATSHATPGIVRSVSTFIHTLRHDPACEFIAVN
jgi:tetratricopeptide (TPR) repeat protein